jgi:hypothetical protein
VVVRVFRLPWTRLHEAKAETALIEEGKAAAEDAVTDSERRDRDVEKVLLAVRSRLMADYLGQNVQKSLRGRKP